MADSEQRPNSNWLKKVFVILFAIALQSSVRQLADQPDHSPLSQKLMAFFCSGDFPLVVFLMLVAYHAIVQFIRDHQPEAIRAVRKYCETNRPDLPIRWIRIRTKEHSGTVVAVLHGHFPVRYEYYLVEDGTLTVTKCGESEFLPLEQYRNAA